SHYTNREGIDKIWQILNNPPSRTSMIVKPSTYTPQALPVPNYDSLFSDSVAILEVPEWKVTVQAMGDFKIQSHLGAVPRAQRESIMKRLEKSSLLNFSNSAAEFGQTIDAAVFQFSDESGAASMVSALELLNQNDINSAEASALVELLMQKKISYDAADGVVGSAVRYRTKTVILGEATTSVIQVIKNHVVAQLIYTGVDLKKRPVDAFLRYVVERFE
ncbi:MAG: hypothetical protein P1V20_01930, partial [Verrucomicrobiales bacterium]|nr:hypothetical protein [Verrucomicrobiales bacterium]